MDKNDDVRKFLIPKINFNAKDYTEMIDWTIDITEPPLTKDFSKAAIQSFIYDPPKNSDIFKYPCHTQVVERHIKLVSECSTKVCDETVQETLTKSVIGTFKKCPSIILKNSIGLNKSYLQLVF